MGIFKEITECDLCKSANLTIYLDFGLSPLANSLKSTEEEKEPVSPLRIAKCGYCDCFELMDLVDPKILFGNTYNYRSAKGLEKHFAEYAKTTINLLGINPNEDMIVGIGGNTGLLEIEYRKLGFWNTINIEPAKNIAQESKDNKVLTFNYFFSAKVAKYITDAYQFGQAKLITCNNCFAHTGLDPIIEGIKVFLEPNGYLVIENSYWLDVIKNSDIGQVYAEHYKYLSIKPLQKFFDLHGFDLFKVAFNQVQCGSFRAYVKWKTNKQFEIDKSVGEAIKKETEFGLYNKEIYSNLYDKIDKINYNLLSFLGNIGNKKIGIYGVPAKIVLLLQYFNIQDRFKFACDDSEIKWNKYIPGTSIKILEPKEFWSKDFDYVLVGAYNFFDQIVSNNKDKNVKWIRILPNFEII